jgi:hypothetical protein
VFHRDRRISGSVAAKIELYHAFMKTAYQQVHGVTNFCDIYAPIWANERSKIVINGDQGKLEPHIQELHDTLFAR